jgi:hypothetical protein
LYTVSSLGFILIGVTGSMLRTNVFPEVILTYTQASGAERETRAVVFKILSDVVFNGLGVVESFVVGVWWLGIGLIMRSERGMLGTATAMLGAVTLVAIAGIVLQVDPASMLLGITFFLAPLWALWLGIDLWRRGEQVERSMEAEAAG